MIYCNGKKLIGKVVITDADKNASVVNGLNARYHKTDKTDNGSGNGGDTNEGVWNPGWDDDDWLDS